MAPIGVCARNTRCLVVPRRLHDSACSPLRAPLTSFANALNASMSFTGPTNPIELMVPPSLSRPMLLPFSGFSRKSKRDGTPTPRVVRAALVATELGPLLARAVVGPDVRAPGAGRRRTGLTVHLPAVGAVGVGAR